MKKTNAAAAAAAGALVTAGLAVSWRDGHRFVVRHYQISSSKIRENTRIVFLSDLHSQVYGKKNDPDGPNGPLLRAIRSLNPDAVMIGGDMIVAKDAASDKPGWKEVPLDLIESLRKSFRSILQKEITRHSLPVNGWREDTSGSTWNITKRRSASAQSACTTDRSFFAEESGCTAWILTVKPSGNFFRTIFAKSRWRRTSESRIRISSAWCSPTIRNSFRSMRTGEQTWCCPGISMEGSSDWDRRDRDFCLRTGTFSRIIQEGSTGFEEKTERRPRWF